MTHAFDVIDQTKLLRCIGLAGTDQRALGEWAAAEIERLTAEVERLRARITKAGVMVDQGYGPASISEFLWSALNQQTAVKEE